MNPAQIRCPGCDRTFSPSGLAHHISKTSDSRCHGFNTAPQTQSISGTSAQTGFSPALAPTHVSDVSGSAIPGGDSNNPPDLERQIYASEFDVGHKQCRLQFCQCNDPHVQKAIC